MAARRVLSMLAMVIASVLALAARDDQQQTFLDQRRLQSGVDLVMVTATVLDAEGHLVTGLPRDAFSIWEDGLEQAISVFSAERMPVGLGVLLDVSDSMFGQRMVDAR